MEHFSELERVFQVWDYTVSHSQMVLRSPAGTDAPMNIDLIFTAVIYMRLPSVLSGLEFVESTQEEVAEVQAAIDSLEGVDETIWVLASGGARFIVAAGALRIDRNSLPLMKTAIIHAEDR